MYIMNYTIRNTYDISLYIEYFLSYEVVVTIQSSLNVSNPKSKISCD